MDMFKDLKEDQMIDSYSLGIWRPREGWQEKEIEQGLYSGLCESF